MNAAATVALKPFLGDWVNTNPSTAWIRAFTISTDVGQPVIDVSGVEAPKIWGRAVLDVFCFKAGEYAFRAEFRRPLGHCELIAYTNMGLIVVAAYFDFEDERLGGHLCREFYVPEGKNGASF